MEIKDEELVKKIVRRFSETFHVGQCGEPTMPTENKVVLTFGFIGDKMSDYKIYLAIYDNGFTVNVRYENEARKKFHENYVSKAYYSDIKSSEDFCKKIAAAIFVEIHTFCDDDIIPHLVDWIHVAGLGAGSDPIKVMKEYSEKNLNA